MLPMPVTHPSLHANVWAGICTYSLCDATETHLENNCTETCYEQNEEHRPIAKSSACLEVDTPVPSIEIFQCFTKELNSKALTDQNKRLHILYQPQHDSSHDVLQCSRRSE